MTKKLYVDEYDKGSYESSVPKDFPEYDAHMFRPRPMRRSLRAFIRIKSGKFVLSA
jgi:hypothetical protein